MQYCPPCQRTHLPYESCDPIDPPSPAPRPVTITLPAEILATIRISLRRNRNWLQRRLERDKELPGMARLWRLQIEDTERALDEVSDLGNLTGGKR